MHTGFGYTEIGRNVQLLNKGIEDMKEIFKNM